MTSTDKVLITGATGNIASGVIPALLSAGGDIRALVRDESKAQSLRDQGVEVVVGDFEKPETLGPAFDGISKVLLLTSPNPNAVQQTSNGIAAAKRAGVSHVVRQSAFVPEPVEKARLGKIHAQSDQELKESGIPYTILRPTFFMQNIMMAAQTVASDSMIYLPLKDGRLGMIDVRDIIECHVSVLTSDGQHVGREYTLTGPASVSFHDVAAGFSKALDKEVKYVNVPPEAAKEFMMGMGMPEWVADAYVELFKNFSENGANRATKDVEQITGHPPISIEQFARDFAQAFGGNQARNSLSGQVQERPSDLPTPGVLAK